VPHLTLEYTDNLDFEVQPLLSRLHDELVATGAINLKGIKSRAIRHTEYRVASGNKEYGFVHVHLVIREGRSLEVQQAMAQRLMSALEEAFGSHFDSGFLSLSVDIGEMRESIALTQHNIPAIDQSSGEGGR
jgi:5-carboxymethyl-2-hydroxymuconate isomerase